MKCCSRYGWKWIIGLILSAMSLRVGTYSTYKVCKNTITTFSSSSHGIKSLDLQLLPQPLWLCLISCTSVINNKAMYFLYTYLLLKGQTSCFLHFSQKRWDVRNVSCVWASVLKLQRKQSLSITKVTRMYAGLHVQCMLFSSDFNQNWSAK